MKIILKILFITLLMHSLSFAQNVKLENIKQNFENFNFRSVITLTNEALNKKENYSQNDLINLFTMQAVSYYSLSKLDSARIAFIDLLKVDKNYQLDSMEVSPKIINFYKNVKMEFDKITEVDESHAEKIDTVRIESKPKIIYDNSVLKNSLFRSIVLPGWGHLYINENTKGWLLGTLGVAALSGSIYYFFDSRSKEKLYLNESNPALINQRYEDYNSSYKMRNALIITYAAVWLYTQIDLIFFSDESSFDNSLKEISLLNLKCSPGYYGIYLKLTF